MNAPDVRSQGPEPHRFLQLSSTHTCLPAPATTPVSSTLYPQWVRLFFVEYFSPISRAFLTTDEPSPVRFRGDGFRPAAHRDGPPAFFGCPTPPGPRPPGA